MPHNIQMLNIRPLPANREDWKRVSLRRYTIVDMTEEMHNIALSEYGETYTRYLSAVFNEQAIEGAIKWDNAQAAHTLRELAKRQEPPHALANERIGAIVRALNYVLRRYGESRKQRRDNALAIASQESKAERADE